MQYPASKLPQVGTTIFSVMSQLAAQHGAINLSQGFPDFDGPAELLVRVGEYIQQGANQYAPMSGVPSLRYAIADKVRRCYGRTLDAETDVTVTSGATEGLFAAISALVSPGDEVIVFDPAYDSYEPAIALNGGRTLHLPLSLPDFRIDWDRLRDSLTSRTRLIILNSPHNPSGAVLTESDIASLIELVEQTDILLLADEVYEHIVFDGREHLSLNRYPALAERSVIVSSFGKTYHITGWKIGYVVASPWLSAEIRKVHQYLTFSSSTPMQLALADYLRQAPEHDQTLPDFYATKRDLFNCLMAQSRFRFMPTAGTYFQLMDYSQISAEEDTYFARWLTMEAGVAAIPLSVFYAEPPRQMRLVRFCFAKGVDTLTEAAERLCKI